MADAAWRLGSRAVLHAAWHRAPPARAIARRRLACRPPVPPQAGIPTPLGPDRRHEPGRAPTAHSGQTCVAAAALPADDACAPDPVRTGGFGPQHTAAIAAAAARIAPAAWHGPFPPDADPLRLDLVGPGDIRPVWERNRWAELPLLAQAARIAPEGPYGGRLSIRLHEWDVANPAFRGPNWACGQEASLRALHLALALALQGGPTPAAAHAALIRHGQRIAATPAYAIAQDNNHTVSEAAGLLVCGLLGRQPDWVGTGAARFDTAIARLVTRCGAFAQLSTGYHRLLLDVAAVTEWLRRRHDGPPSAPETRQRLGAATAWLHGLTDPATGATPRLGHQDGSCFADLSLAGPDDARASIERAARVFLGHSAFAEDDPGCGWLGLRPGPTLPAMPAVWRTEGVLLRRAGTARALLRTGPVRFRPGHADLLHLDLWDGGYAVLRDGGTGAYNPPAETGWWHEHFTGTAAHNTITFDDRDQMPRAGRFLFARWPRTGALPDGAWMRDHRGCRQARTVAADGRRWTVADSVAGPFRTATLRWRLGDGAWRPTATGADGPARIAVRADAALSVAIETGWFSPAYGVVEPCQVLTARAAAPVTRLVTTVDLA